MKGKNKIRRGAALSKVLSICLMAFCMTFLTSLNYFLYPDQDIEASTHASGTRTGDTNSKFPPSGPTEEKPSGPGYSFVEEILHENFQEINPSAIDHGYLHHIAEAEGLELFHPELISPPPKS